MRCEAHYSPLNWKIMWHCRREAFRKLHGGYFCEEHYKLLKFGKPWPKESFDEHTTKHAPENEGR